jgi:hypothetical protein
MAKRQAAGLVAAESGMNRRQISPPRKLPKLMKRPITRLLRVFRINLSILGAARAEKAGPYSSCRNGAANISAAVVVQPVLEGGCKRVWEAAINAKRQQK